jgi:hypothetical protein
LKDIAMTDAPKLEDALAALLPVCLTPEQRARYAGIAAIVRRTVEAVPHARSEFEEPASVFDMPTRVLAEKE